MSFGQIIKGTMLPRVAVKELAEEDSSSGGSASKVDVAYVAPTYLPNTAQKTGSRKPFVKIGGQIVKDIDTMVIDETGFIPTITLSFTDGLGEFGGDYFPKTDLIMMVYVKAPTEKFKPIRCDFLITSISSMAKMGPPGDNGVSVGTKYTVKGELNVPGIYHNLSKSYRNLSSKDAIKKICGDLGLGFAENDSSPSDAMTWINYNTSTLKFIQDVLDHSYQDDDSFFSGFIDKYYFLNYIEVNRQLKVEEANKTYVAFADLLMSGPNQIHQNDPNTEKMSELTMMNYLTTEVSFTNASNFIGSLSLISNQGTILKNQGYKKNIYYYDHFKKADSPVDKFTDFYVSPLKSIDRRQSDFLVPQEESLAENTVKKWMNIDYGNTHPQWNAARLINTHNLKELDKIKLKVKLNNIHYQNVRGFVVPVYVSIRQAEKLLKSTDSNDDLPDSKTQLDKEAPDEQLSGYYYVSGVKYRYDKLDPQPFSTEMFLARREWRPSKNANISA